MTLGKIIEIHKEKLGDVFEIRYRMMATDESGTMRDVGLSGQSEVFANSPAARRGNLL